MSRLPFVTLCSVSVLLFAIGIYLIAVHTSLATRAAARTSLAGRARSAGPFLIGAFLAVWFAVGFVIGDDRNFPPANPAMRLLSLLVVGYVPMLLAIGLLFSSSTLRAINAAMPPEWLIRVQIYRTAGLMFLFPFLYYGVIPAAFAVPAAIGDFLTGLTAPWVAHQMARRRPGALALAIAWNVFGMLDLIVAPASAILSRAAIRDLYPLVLVPLFLGPPLGILTHVLSLRNLVATSRASARPASLNELAGAA